MVSNESLQMLSGFGAVVYEAGGIKIYEEEECKSRKSRSHRKASLGKTVIANYQDKSKHVF